MLLWVMLYLYLFNMNSNKHNFKQMMTGNKEFQNFIFHLLNLPLGHFTPSQRLFTPKGGKSVLKPTVSRWICEMIQNLLHLCKNDYRALWQMHRWCEVKIKKVVTNSDWLLFSLFAGERQLHVYNFRFMLVNWTLNIAKWAFIIIYHIFKIK